MGYTESRVLA